MFTTKVFRGEKYEECRKEREELLEKEGGAENTSQRKIRTL